MELPESLPARTYLAACDTDKRRLVAGDRIGYVLRAAALAELLLLGAVSDEGGRPRAEPVTVTDEYCAELHAAIRDDKPLTWQRWLRRDARHARRRVGDQVVAAGWIRLERRRLLGVIPVERITVRDTRRHKAFVRQLGRLGRGGEPVSRVPRRDAAVLTLAATGELRTVMTWSDRRRHRDRLAGLAASIEPVATALRKLIRQVRAQRGAAASGG